MDIDLQDLKRIAEAAATQEQPLTIEGDIKLRMFKLTITPQTVLALIAEIEMLRDDYVALLQLRRTGV